MRLIEQAVAAHSAGQLNEAEKLYRQVLTGDPHDFDALHMLGVIAAQRQQFDEAERLMRAAIAVDGKVPPCLHHYGNVLSMLKQYEQAIPFYDRAIALAPNHAPIYSDRGNAKRALGALDEAVASYNRALALNPNLAPALGNLAQALMDLNRHEEAAELLRRALALNPNNASAVKLSGRLAFERGDLEAALAHSQRAIALKPDQADAYSVMGNALRDLGRLPQAREAYGNAIALNPDNATFYFGISDCKKFEAGDPQLAAMEAMAAKGTGLSKLDRMYLDFALGKAYADIKDYPRSFQHLAAANAAKRETITYEEPTAFALFDEIERVFSAALMKAKAGGGDPSRRPIFVIGMPRSGTTLIEQLLASHPAVHGAGELTTFNDVVQAAAGAQGGSYPEFVATLDQAALRAIGADYERRLASLNAEKKHVTNKLPLNFLLIGLIHLALPNATIIHTMRDPLDTCVSCYSKLFKLGEQNYAYELGELGRYYRRYRRLMQHWRNVLPPGRLYEIQYEAVVADLEGETRRLLDQCGLAWDPRCLDFHKTDRPVRTASAAQIREPLFKSAVGRWRVYEAYLGPLLAELSGER